MTNNNILKVNLQKTYKEVEVGKLIIKLPIDNESLDRFRNSTISIDEEFANIENPTFEDTKKYCIDLIESLLNVEKSFNEEGIGEKIFEECGKSSIVMADLLHQLIDFISGAMEETAKSKHNKMNNYKRKKSK